MSLIFVVLLAAEIHGYISDEACGWNNARPGKEAQECARKCVDAGWPAVLVIDGGMKAYKIEGESVRAFVGEHVTVTGDLVGAVVRAKKVRKSPDPKAPGPAKP